MCKDNASAVLMASPLLVWPIHGDRLVSTPPRHPSTPERRSRACLREDGAPSPGRHEQPSDAASRRRSTARIAPCPHLPDTVPPDTEKLIDSSCIDMLLKKNMQHP
jgi:hypothetical protein